MTLFPKQYRLIDAKTLEVFNVRNVSFNEGEIRNSSPLMNSPAIDENEDVELVLPFEELSKPKGVKPAESKHNNMENADGQGEHPGKTGMQDEELGESEGGDVEEPEEVSDDKPEDEPGDDLDEEDVTTKNVGMINMPICRLE